MARIICAINMTLDGYFDHTIALADDHVHAHYTQLLKKGNVILYGRKTFELMLYWRDALNHTNIDSKHYEFAKAINIIPKIIFSNSLQSTNWPSATLATITLKETINNLKYDNGADVYIGSRSLMIQLLEAKLLDELQLCIHPVVNPHGRLLFEGLENRFIFNQKRVKTLAGGHIILSLCPIY